ncbi:MAG: glycine--tRNA ligase subunit beta [Pseudomonadota bacterium]
MSDFLLELLSEEIPARMQARARADLQRMMAEALQRAALGHGAITAFSTPRRLALIVRDVASSTAAVNEELKGPRTSAPPQALDGFLRKTGLTQDQLEDRDGTWFAVIDKPGRNAVAVIAEAVQQIIADFPWPKSMRWGEGDLKWVRPLHSIIALLGDDIVPVDVAGITAGAATLGHRFHHPGPITIGGAGDYVEKLRACHVLVDQAEREALIRDGAASAAKAAGFALIEDEGLVVENAGLTEWPVPLAGQFDPDFLDVPREVIVLTMRTNQKYFACAGEDGGLAPAFVCVANIDANDGGASIVEGNRRVLAARLSDARFFWEQDLKIPLEEQAKKLDGIVFHEKLGTVADKVERVAKLARWLVEEGIVGTLSPRGRGQGEGAQGSSTKAEPPHPGLLPAGEKGKLADLAERAARLAKADLVTGMVGEFPELQGVIGGYLAETQGEPKAVSNAIRDHYKPVGQGDDVPTAAVTVAVSLADKLDTLVCFFAIQERPTGSRDPFALRRAILGIIEIIVENKLRVGMRWLASEGYRVFADQLTDRWHVVWQDLLDASKWSPLLRGDAAYADDGKILLVLNDAPPAIAAEVVNGASTWDPVDLRHRELVAFEAESFVTSVNEVTEFCFDRLRDREKRAGRRSDLISAVLPRNFMNALVGLEIADEWVKLANTTANDDVVRILKLGESLQVFIGSNDGANLLAAYKRAANILKKEEGSWTPDQVRGDDFASEEAALTKVLDKAESKATAAIVKEDFTVAMAALASLRAPIDAFFDAVKVNADDPGTRARRLNLLARFTGAVNRVADFSKIEG